VSRVGAVVLTSPKGRAFVRAEDARQIVPQPRVSRVPNSPFGMALVGGRVVSVLSVGTATGALLVSDIDGEAVAFSGLRLERVGEFELEPGGARVDGELVPELSLRKLLQRTLAAGEATSWS
jgi:hypothetical protein